MEGKRNYKITNCQFILSIFIVLIHASCLFMNVPGKELQTVFGFNVASFIQLFIGEGICRIAVPLFMVISGYLFYLSFDGSWKSYGNKLKRRIFSLVIPYLFWSTLTFLLFFFAQKFLGLGSFFVTRNDTSINLWYLFDNIILNSYDSPLWFCRYLIVFAVLSIVLYWPLKKVPWLMFALFFYLWIFNGNFFYFLPSGLRLDSIFFYMFGAIMALHPDFFQRINSRINKPIVLSVTAVYCIFLSLRTTYFCFQNPDYLLIGTPNSVLDVSSKICIPLGMFSFWYLFDYIVKTKNHIWKLSKYSFLIFAAHHPIISVIKKLVFDYIPYNNLTSLAICFVGAISTVLIILLVGKIVHRFIPWLWKISTGNR